jgi:hypothetical protein
MILEESDFVLHVNDAIKSEIKAEDNQSAEFLNLSPLRSCSRCDWVGHIAASGHFLTSRALKTIRPGQKATGALGRNRDGCGSGAALNDLDAM